MARQRKYSKEEFARLGEDMYEHRIRAQVENGNTGKIVAMDLDSGTYEVGENTLTAAQQLLARCPDAQIWCVRIGHRGVHHFGAQAMLA